LSAETDTASSPGDIGAIRSPSFERDSVVRQVVSPEVRSEIP